MSWLDDIANKYNNDSNDEKGISMDKLIPYKNNFYGLREIDELAESIKSQGLLQNLVVRDLNNGYYEILAGHRRHAALKKLGEEKAKCLVLKDVSDKEADIIMIVTNSTTRELTPSEKIRGINRLEELIKSERSTGEVKGKTRDIIGQAMGISGTHVGRLQKIGKKLDEDLQEDLDENKLTIEQAEIIANLKPDEQKEIAKQIKDLDIKESKEEISILIDGIKQPVREKDNELLKETYPEAKNKENNSKTAIVKFESKEQIKTIEELCEERIKTLGEMLPAKKENWSNFNFAVKGQLDAFELIKIVLRDKKNEDLSFEFPLEDGELNE